ncbi:MAG: leucine-rich repeat domain-containing protein [Bacilli bacterium]|nr:leucine-rich repeat domain-containing protein [Bacilli bacterium]
MKKKLVLMTSALMTIGLLAGCGNQHTHEWGDVSYTWAEDNSTCTATRVCKGDESHVETETVDTTSVVVTEATCEENGLKRYTADFKTNEAFLDQTKDVTLEALGHDYQFVEFVWEGFFAAKAKYVCSHDDSHVELHDAQVADLLVNPATCEEEGLRTWTATYGDHSETKNQTIEALGHTMVHVDAKQATCEEDGNIEHWHCTVCEKNYEDELGTKPLNNVVTEKLGHDWNEPTYEWNADHTECTATRTCKRDGSHKESETVQATLEVTTPSGCTTVGAGKRTATFENAAFATQTIDVVIDAKGHNYKITYTWADDYSTCTAKAICQNDNEHVFEETKASSYKIYDDNGVIKCGYFAEFDNEIFNDAKADIMILEKINGGAAYSVKAANKNIKGAIEIPASYDGKPITDISDDGFNGCGITSVVIPASVKSLNIRALAACTSLTTVTFADGSQLNLIGHQCFDGCRKLSTIIFGGTIERWNNIQKDFFWADSVPCKNIQCSDGLTPLVNNQPW